MKKQITALVILAACGLGLTSMADSKGSEETSVITVPAALEDRVISTATSQHLISESDAKAIRDTDAIQRCVNAFVNSGYQPSAAVDELAETAVEAGKFTSKNSAKQAMKQGIEKARKNESNWAYLYSLLGI